VLDAAGNTTSAIGKGYATSGASLISITIFSAIITRLGISQVNLLSP